MNSRQFWTRCAPPKPSSPTFSCPPIATRTDDRQARGHSRPSRGRQGHAVVARLGAPERRAADAAKNVGRGELTRFAAGLCETNFLSAMPHEKPRLEATLAGFDIRSPRVGPFAGVTAAT